MKIYKYVGNVSTIRIFSAAVLQPPHSSKTTICLTVMIAEFSFSLFLQQELLNILGMEDFNDSEMETIIHELYKKISENPFIQECVIKLSGQFLNIDKEIGLMLMFSYDYMYLTHICVSELLDTGSISETNISNLRSIIF